MSRAWMEGLGGVVNPQRPSRVQGVEGLGFRA